MREALAAADHDFVLTEPASKLHRLRQKLFTPKWRGSHRAGRRDRRYAIILAAGFFVATAAAIVLNALVWQRTRHPAPLFAREALTREPMIARLTTVPPPRPQPAVTPIQAQNKPGEAPPLEMPAGGNPRQASVNSSPPHDEIANLLMAPPASPARPATAVEKPAAGSKSVLAAQRALVKLGFVLNPDGLAGAATRQAIERYERDHGLPVHGKVTPALIRHLRAETGITLN